MKSLLRNNSSPSGDILCTSVFVGNQILDTTSERKSLFKSPGLVSVNLFDHRFHIPGSV